MNSTKKINIEEARRLHQHMVSADKSIQDIVSKETIRYMEHMVDPKNVPSVPMPATGHGRPGLVRKIPMKAIINVTVGSGGYGFLTVDPQNALACTDRAIAIGSIGAYTGTSASYLEPAVTAGSSLAYATNTGFTAAGLGSANGTGKYFEAKVNACGIYVDPISAALDQNGKMFLLEVPLHPAFNNQVETLTLGEVENHPRTRSIRATQLDPAFQNVVNWHPVNDIYSGSANNFAAPTAASTTLGGQVLVVVFTGTPGTQYQVSVYGSWLARGLHSGANTPQWCDPVGISDIFNLTVIKRISGWEGDAAQTIRLYKAAMLRAHQYQLPQAEVERDKAVAALDNSKAQALSNKKSSKSPDWWNIIQELKPVAKAAAGFFF